MSENPTSADRLPAVAAPAAGIRLGGRYRLDDRMAETGEASVWKAVDEVLNRPVIAWALPPGRPAAVEVITAVLDAARVTDPRLARIFDADCDTDSPYVISEWAPGENLEDLLAAGLPGPALAATIIAAAADALATAHAAGRPHLCLTPRSLLWSSSGVKITGLGVEAALSGTTAADPAAADARALAHLLYALLTGYWPGEAATALPPAPRHRGVPYSPRRVRAGVPGVLDIITCRALLPDPALPVLTPAQLARDLRTAQRTLQRRAAPPVRETRPAPRPRETPPRWSQTRHRPARHASPAFPRAASRATAKAC